MYGYWIVWRKKIINYDEFLYCEFICIVFEVGGLVVWENFFEGVVYYYICFFCVFIFYYIVFWDLFFFVEFYIRIL